MNPTQKIGLGGGCHWCTEGIFQMLRGVVQVDQGFIRADPPANVWAEGIVVHFDSSVIDLPTLIEVHLRTHAASATYVATSKYRSAIYVQGDAQRRQATRTIASLQPGFEDVIGTQVLSLGSFKPSDDRFRNYYANNPDKPFCRRYIDPKVDLIRRNFAEIIAPPSMGDINSI